MVRVRPLLFDALWLMGVSHVSRVLYPWQAKLPTIQRLHFGRCSSHLTCRSRHVQQPVKVFPRLLPAVLFSCGRSVALSADVEGRSRSGRESLISSRSGAMQSRFPYKACSAMAAVRWNDVAVYGTHVGIRFVIAGYSWML